MLESIIKARIAELKLMFLATRKIGHAVEKGALREAFVINLIQQFLPEHFGLGSGIVIDKHGKQSVQVDIVVYDKRIAPPVIEAAGRGVYLIDAVLRVIEVKSVLTKASLDQFARMIQCFDPTRSDSLKVSSAGRLEKSECYYPVCAMFGFTSKIPDLGQACDENPIIRQSQSLIYSDDGRLWTNQELNFDNFEFPFNGRSLEFDEEARGLRLFIGMLFNLIEETALSRSLYRPIDWVL